MPQHKIAGAPRSTLAPKYFDAWTVLVDLTEWLMAHGKTLKELARDTNCGYTNLYTCSQLRRWPLDLYLAAHVLYAKKSEKPLPIHASKPAFRSRIASGMNEQVRVLAAKFHKKWPHAQIPRDYTTVRKATGHKNVTPRQAGNTMTGDKLTALVQKLIEPLQAEIAQLSLLVAEMQLATAKRRPLSKLPAPVAEIVNTDRYVKPDLAEALSAASNGIRLDYNEYASRDWEHLDDAASRRLIKFFARMGHDQCAWQMYGNPKNREHVKEVFGTPHISVAKCGDLKVFVDRTMQGAWTLCGIKNVNDKAFARREMRYMAKGSHSYVS